MLVRDELLTVLSNLIHPTRPMVAETKSVLIESYSPGGAWYRSKNRVTKQGVAL